MKKRDINIIILIVFLLFIAGWNIICLIFATGCHELLPLGPGSVDSVEVHYQITTCTKKIIKPNWVPPVIQNNTNYPWIKLNCPAQDLCYHVLPNFIESDNISIPGNNKIYYDLDVLVYDTNYPLVKGAYFIQGRDEDFDVKAQDFLAIEIKDDVENFYIAYEARLDRPPNWLQGADPSKDEYEKLVNPQNSAEPYTLTLSTGDKLQLWRRKKAPAKGEIVRLPGNTYGNPLWQGLKDKPHPNKENPYMYVVIIMPASLADMQSPQCTTEDFYFNHCFENFAKDYPNQKVEDVGEQLARQEAGPLSSNQTFGLIKSTASKIAAGKCEFVNSIRGKTFSLHDRTFKKNSEIEFFKGVSVVNVAITVDGQQKTYQGSVSGRLDFQYLLDQFNSMKTMQINSLNLQADPLNTDVGKIDQINIRLLTSCKATCQDSPPPVLCKNYQIPAGDFMCTESCTVDGKPVYLSTINTQPVDIQVDLQQNTFQIKPTGSFQGSIKTSDRDIPVTIDIDLKGKFTNFAPTVIISKEYPPYAECVEKRNKVPITLLAKAIDPDGPLPPANFEWYQDYGLVTQKFWRKGDKLIINPGQLQYGAHLFTVVLKDTQGMIDQTAVLVEVRDTTKPSLTIPPDINLIQFHEGPFRIHLGKATAGDSCYPGPVLLSNDPPENLFFPLGHTKVTWTADDLRGNSDSKVQNVYILSLRNRKLMPSLKEFSGKLTKSLQDSQQAFQETQDWPESSIDLEPLLTSMHQLRDLVKDRSVQEGQADLGRQIAEKLTLALTALQQSNNLIQDSNQAERRNRRALREQVGSRLTKALTLMKEVTALSPQK